MFTSPERPTAEEVAEAVAAGWLPGGEARAEYAAVGFGAHHWRVTAPGHTLFATLDGTADVETAYAAAAALAAAGVEAVWAPIPARGGQFTVPLADGVLSVTPWLDGRTPSAEEAAEPAHARAVAALVASLHRAPPPERIAEWRPCVPAGFAEDVRRLTARPWADGPMGEEARALLGAAGDRIARWTDRYHRLAALARDRRDTWVPTHGEPHFANQIAAAGGGLRLVDWETLALAPRERDTTRLPPAGTAAGPPPDPAFAELFTLDWTLSELDSYSRWFAAPHTGSADDRTALGGLRGELN